MARSRKCLRSNMNRIDFVCKNTHCSKCGRALKSNIAVIYNGCAFGRKCAQNKKINVCILPNLIKGIDVEEDNIPYDVLIHNNNINQTHKIDEKRCIEYLLLRCVKLAEIHSMKIEKLSEIYERFCNENRFLENDIVYLRNLINKMNKDKTVYCERNLHFCYLCFIELNRLIRTEGNTKFYEDLLKFLKRNAYLSEKQFNAIKKYLKINIKFYKPNIKKSF